jgi:hypothetical protein
VTSLTCGANATGNSVLVSYDKYSGAEGDSQPICRCLVNVGDGTQRFCSERRIKLSTISCIVVTSLAPHNLSGFSGVFLSLSDMVRLSDLSPQCFFSCELRPLIFTVSGCRETHHHWSSWPEEQPRPDAAHNQPQVPGPRDS